MLVQRSRREEEGNMRKERTGERLRDQKYRGRKEEENKN
jgi:hypothetical protein